MTEHGYAVFQMMLLCPFVMCLQSLHDWNVSWKGIGEQWQVYTKNKNKNSKFKIKTLFPNSFFDYLFLIYTGCDWSASNDLLVTSSVDGQICVWNTSTHNCIRSVKDVVQAELLSCLFHPVNNNFVVVSFLLFYTSRKYTVSFHIGQSESTIFEITL